MWHSLELDLLLSAIAWKCIGSIPLCKLNIHGWVIETPRKDSYRIYICFRQPPINLVKCRLSLTFDHRNLIVFFLQTIRGLVEWEFKKDLWSVKSLFFRANGHTSTWKLSSNCPTIVRTSLYFLFLLHWTRAEKIGKEITFWTKETLTWRQRRKKHFENLENLVLAEQRKTLARSFLSFAIAAVWCKMPHHKTASLAVNSNVPKFNKAETCFCQFCQRTGDASKY